MIKNPILFIIDNNGDYLRYGGTLRAINGYREFAFVISPRPLTDSVSMSIMTNNANYNRFEQYVLPTAIKVNELIEESDALYQTIADWNVFGVEIKPTALADISNFRSGATTFSFQFQTPHPSTKCVTYKGVFGVDNPLPTTGQVLGDYYECEDWNFYLTSGTQTYTFTKGMYVYFNGSRWIKDALLVELNTSTVSIPVEPSHAVGYEIDDDDANYLASIGAAAILAQQTAEQSAQDFEDLKDGTTPIFFDKTGTDLDAGFIEEAIKEVNVKTNANKQNIEKIVDGTTTVKKAEQDKNGNDIVDTYETKSDATSKLALKADKTYVDSQDQALDDKIDLLDGRVEDLEIANMIKSYTYNPTTHVITFTYYDNTTTSFDLPLESAIVSASYDDVTQDITFVLQSGATLVVPLDDLVSGLASETWVTTYFIPKTALKTSFSATPLDTNVISEKLAKDTFDTKEDIANKAIDFSVVNDTKYPTTKAVADNFTTIFKLINAINKGDFSDGLNGWTIYGGGSTHTITVIGNTLSILRTSLGDNVSFGQTKAFVVGHKYYSSFEIASSYDFSTANLNYIATVDSYPTYNITGTNTKHSVIQTVTSNDGLYILANNLNITNGEQIAIKNVMMFDLSDIFGVGKEPNQAQMDEIVNELSIDGFIEDVAFTILDIINLFVPKQQEEWLTPTLTTATTTYLKYRKDNFGVVAIEGNITVTTAGTNFTLPTGYRPLFAYTVGILTFNTDGTVVSSATGTQTLSVRFTGGA